jgi:curved DNA-binding protein CbpA
LTPSFSSRKAAKANHPDMGGSEEKMAAINEAYKVLSDDGKRTLISIESAST